MSVSTKRQIITTLVSFVVTVIVGIWAVPFLKRLKYGQTINEVGPTWHKAKQGTPTMGGIIFIIGIIISVITGSLSLGSYFQGGVEFVRLASGLIMALAFALVGFIDDYVKVVKKRNLGLTAIQKTILQLLIAIGYMMSLYISGDRSTVLIIPFIGQLDLGVLYYPICVLMIYSWVNAVNITDGIDGLCSSVTFFLAIGFVVISGMLAKTNMSLLSVALAGGMLGFLVWNFYPAKVFMGDTGSLFLGGVIVALGFGTEFPLLLLFTGIMYLVDIGSVFLQILSVKLTGKRIFKMSPIHHSFEISGYSEVKIVGLFSFITVIGCIIATIAVKMYMN